MAVATLFLNSKEMCVFEMYGGGSRSRETMYLLFEYTK